MTRLQSGTTYCLESSDRSISATYVSLTLVGDLEWYKFLVGPKEVQFVKINDYLCSPFGNFRITWP